MQPPYSVDLTRSDELFDYKMKLLEECDASMDIIVLPEYSEVPCVVSSREEVFFYHNKYINTLLDACVSTAKRCGAYVFVNALSEEETGFRNTTYVFGRDGALLGKYFKKHLAPSELNSYKLDSDYTYEFSEPYIIELEGIRFGFLTCYDFYFYEAYANIARQNVDIIIGCSHQRSDSHDAIEIMCRHLAYNTNAYVIRSSVSFAEDSEICGASMVVSPYGKVLANMRSHFGMETVTFDPKDKMYKPAGYGNAPAPHYKYIEFGRKPWQYRPAGSAIIKNDYLLSYPRVCAHRGFNTIAPENSMPAFGAAVAMGAEEIEFDVWPTRDGEIVSCHDRELDRVSTGTGLITDYTLKELRRFDFGIKYGEAFRGLKVLTLEEILKKLSCHVIMNIHVKPLSYTEPYPEDIMKKLCALIKKYDCEEYVYFMLETDGQIKQFKAYAPEIAVCVGHLHDRPWDIVDRAIEFGCEKVQLFKPFYSREMIEKAHEHGIKCNVFWSDDPKEAEELLALGVDTILTNDYNRVSQAVKRRGN